MKGETMDRTLCRHNLGGAILSRAIADYRKQDPFLHEMAKAFLYPRDAAARGHFLWVVSLLPEMDPAWLRDQLDCHQMKWDGQRRMHLAAKA